MTDALTIFGIVAVGAMVVAYALESRSRAFVLLFAASCLAAALYALLEGAWPFALAEIVWSAIALRRWTARAARAT